MYNKKLSKIYAGCALSLALAMAVTPINAFAAESNPVAPPTTSTKQEKIDPTAAGYEDTNIDVWGITKEEIVYSVDVEWGAMTFKYEAGIWNADSHTMGAGRGWLVYDQSTDDVLDNVDAQDAINRVTVTNHSNASVYAKLTYTDGTGSESFGTTGAFAALDTSKQTETETSTDSNAEFDATKGLITLQTANNGTNGAAGTPAVGNVYFKPDGIPTNKEIAELSKIGKITVALSTTDPTATPGVS